MQLVLIESALVAVCASLLGALFASWAAPFVVSAINPPYNPARLALSTDWRVLVFSVVLTLGVTFLFGLVPALRASAVRPVSALKGERILATQAPKLPMPACTMPEQCHCRFLKYSDRREDDHGRRFRFGRDRSMWYSGSQRRQSCGRRPAD